VETDNLKPQCVLSTHAGLGAIYLVVYQAPLPVTKSFWNVEQSNWIGAGNHRNRVAKYVIYSGQLIGKHRSQAIALLRMPLGPVYGPDSTGDLVSDLWNRTDYEGVERQRELKKYYVVTEKPSKIIYRIGIEPWNSFFDPTKTNVQSPRNSESNYYAIERLEILMNDSDIIVGVQTEVSKQHGASIAPQLLR
jgi:hypothetical protein